MSGVVTKQRPAVIAGLCGYGFNVVTVCCVCFQGKHHNPSVLSTDHVQGYCVSTTLAQMMAAGLAAAHLMRNIRPNYDVLSGLASEVRGWVAKLVSESWLLDSRHCGSIGWSVTQGYVSVQLIAACVMCTCALSSKGLY